MGALFHNRTAEGIERGWHSRATFHYWNRCEENVVFTGQGKNHRGLLRKGLFVQNSDVHWIREDLKLRVGEEAIYDVRIRYRQDLEKATLFMRAEKMFVIFEKPQKAIASGQFVAWYNGEELIGSGVIG